MADRWKVGDPCKLTDLRRGKVLNGRIDAVLGSVVHVVTDRGRLFALRGDSTLLQRPKS